MADWSKGSLRSEKINDLVFDWQLYPRKDIDYKVVRSYARSLRAGSIFPPIKVGLLAGKKIAVDGVHRISSRKSLKIDQVDCVVLPFESEAELFAEAVRLNSEHGKCFSEVDVRENIKRLKKYNFKVEDIVALVHVPASEIYREAVTVVTTPSGRKIHCNRKNNCNGQPNIHELLQLKRALMLCRDMAESGCIPLDDVFWKDLVTQALIALRKVRFNG